MTDLNKIIHERTRLKILTLLAASGKSQVSFNEILTQLALTSGNLSVQLKKLQSVGYVKIHKTFKDNKPFTTIEMTVKGLDALKKYVNEMESLLSGLKF